MYNYYINENRIKKNKEKEIKKEKEKKIELRRKSKFLFYLLFNLKEKINKLLNSYEENVKNFVLKMVENPIILKKNRNNQNSNHPKLIFSPNHTNNNISLRKKFFIKNYTPEKEKINEIIQNKKILDKYLEKMKKSKIKQDKIYRKNREPNLIQPSMRYTGRTDFERIYDIIKKKENFYREKNSIKKQLEKISRKSYNIENDNYDEYDMQNINTEKDNFENYNKTELFYEERNFKYNIKKNILKGKKNDVNKKLFLLNILINNKIEKKNSKKIKEKLNQRTHFRALENLKMFKTSTINHNIFKNITHEDKKENKKYQNLFSETMGSDSALKIKIKNKYYSNNKINLIKKNPIFRKIKSVDELKIDNRIEESNDSYLNNKDLNSFYNGKNKDINYLIYSRNKSETPDRKYNINENLKIFKDFNILNNIANENPFLYNLNYIKLKNKSEKKINKEDLNKLKKIAFEKEEKKEKLKDNNNNNQDLTKSQYEDLKREENIFIDGKGYKKSDIDLIAEKILEKCNWDENKVVNRQKEGGLMFTNGMSIKEFEEKYGF